VVLEEQPEKPVGAIVHNGAVHSVCRSWIGNLLSASQESSSIGVAEWGLPARIGAAEKYR
jgi:hypothetical protein